MKIPHLVFGLLFLGIAAVWALVATDVITEDRLTWIGPAILVGAGVIGLAASLASTRNRRNKRQPDYQPVSYQPESSPGDVPDRARGYDAPAEPELDEHTDDHTDDHTKEIR